MVTEVREQNFISFEEASPKLQNMLGHLRVIEISDKELRQRIADLFVDLEQMIKLGEADFVPAHFFTLEQQVKQAINDIDSLTHKEAEAEADRKLE